VSVIAVIALAIGIGLTTAMFSIVHGTLFRGLPFHDPDELLNISSYKPADGVTQLVTVHDYADWRDRQSTFKGLALWIKGLAFLRNEDGRAERYDAGFVSSNLFGLLGVQPLLGRDFVSDDELPSSEPVVILAYGLWQNRFRGDPSIIGRRLILDGTPRSVVGVMPRGFAFPIREQLWLPVNTLRLGPRDGWGRYLVIGRLAEGVSKRDAQENLSSIARTLAAEYPGTNRGFDVVIGPYINEVVGERIVNLASMMLAAVFGVLLVACGNVSILQLTRATLRVKEAAARLALGASRVRVMLQSLAEAFVLSAVGALCGLVLALLRIHQFNGALQSAPMIPFWLDVQLDGTALLVVMGLTIVSTLASGSLPAVQSSRTPLAEILKSESGASMGPRLRSLSRVLVVAELALSCGLLVGAGLMIKTVIELERMNFAFATSDVVTMRVALDYLQYPDDESRVAFTKQFLAKLKTSPGFDRIALTSHLPGMGSGGVSFILEGETASRTDTGTDTRFATISPEFFDALSVRLLAGRPFLENDDQSSARVAIVNQSFTARYLPGESPLGKRVRLIGLAREVQEWTIVGLAPDLAMNQRRAGTGFLDQDSAGLYVPLAQYPQSNMAVVVRSPLPAMSVSGIVRSEMDTMAPGQAVYDINTLDRAIEDQNVYYWLIREAFSALGIAALCLASIGLYGIMSSTVNRRRKEIGIRVAMGAHPKNVLAMVMRQGLLQVGLGIALGLVLAIGFASTLEISLFEVKPWDPMVFSTVVLVLFLSGAVACLIPARRATRVDPVAVLREE
jgi:predicted permease